ncbi:4-carboxymuconolactone decarboxylase domain/alkylhydroperoxidase AhpD family core domain protein [Pseudonocardia sp. Ae168_Ps1]|uniref:carboxymuconolactone decarboxylase family protein n=1 Tax=unclassified Pseudonocardia TaxID=2619320 RepID=UPI00095BE221|nr:MULTISPECIES: carboxymuconolactone decarboxylase family protein [unclassified Pseudonocardia]OLL74777.1 4-carboxymuconolactone decarboxylase domain/alkylhydroperoxidase AhpD family core domain protein [Pseudonocardia sp. Ae150A_Ps1]OLL80769.1 4-carboxymuconolactone decarboxylase domain/alkylhydroperoxidase AhpD family core domain protein [Pseudonocardia sp. Ae168_Ps1]OLL85113.1 4-carboxymuconolactone decarboxylase domain/alkylhydroperoxidase AhpD family core domain protein [Pseudonocardia sp.
MPKPYSHVPDSYRALSALERSTRDDDVLPHTVQELVRLRASQINGCGFCVDMHSHDALESGERTERLFSVLAWREAPWFTREERAALALTEEMTRLADRADAVPDDVWEEAAAVFDERALALLVTTVATINAWNRISVATRQIAGSHRRAA